MTGPDPGMLYGVGVGPGDPELITVKAVRLLRRVPTVLLPHSVDRPSVALSIVRRWMRPTRQRVLFQPYPMTGSIESLERAREEAAGRVCALLKTGGDVACVTEGDPLLYSTFIDLLERTRAALPAVRVEVIPAVSSITACAAVAQAPLARRSERIAVLSATDDLDDLESVLKQFDTVVLLKVRSTFDALVERLEALDLSSGAVLVEECGRPGQRITRDLRSRQGCSLSYFSMVLLCRTRAEHRPSARAGDETPCEAS